MKETFESHYLDPKSMSNHSLLGSFERSWAMMLRTILGSRYFRLQIDSPQDPCFGFPHDTPVPSQAADSQLRQVEGRTANLLDHASRDLEAGHRCSALKPDHVSHGDLDLQRDEASHHQGLHEMLRFLWLTCN